MFKTKFVDSQGQVFMVNQVAETAVGLTVYYTKQDTGQQYSCLLAAFSERFTEVDNYE